MFPDSLTIQDKSQQTFAYLRDTHCHVICLHVCLHGIFQSIIDKSAIQVRKSPLDIGI